MATVLQPSSLDVSIQNRDDIVSGADDPTMLGSSRPISSAPERKKRKKKRDVTIPFMILVSMDFMILLLLWIVYEAQPETNDDENEVSSSVQVKLDDEMVIIKNITLTQLLASINGTSAQVSFPKIIIQPLNYQGHNRKPSFQHVMSYAEKGLAQFIVLFPSSKHIMQPSNNLQRSSSDISDGISFNFENRLFDLLFLSAVRGLLLIVVYGLLRLITRSVIIFTTIASSVLVLIKAAQFDYRRDSDCDCLVYILIFFILATSFAFPWLEFLFLEFNYLPKEIGKYSNINWFSWKAWLWPRKLAIANGVTFDDTSGETRQQQPPRYPSGTRDTSLYVTPSGSPPYTPRARIQPIIEPIAEEREPVLSALDQSYLQQGLECLVVTEDLLSSMDGWKLEKTEGGVSCYSTSIGGKKKWRSESIISCNIHALWQVLYYDFEEHPKWNPQVALTQSFYRINDHTDITYVVSTEAGGGLITSRDFVTVRYWECKDGAYYAVGKAVTHDSMPSQSGKIRGENGPGGYKIIPIDEHHTQFIWLCDTDLKGWLPQYLIDQTIAYMAVQMHQQLARHMERITQDDLPLAVS